MVTLVLDFPVLLLLYYIFPEQYTQENAPKMQPPFIKGSSIYIVLGLFGVGASMLYSVGLAYMSVSTFSLICTCSVCCCVQMYALLINMTFSLVLFQLQAEFRYQCIGTYALTESMFPLLEKAAPDSQLDVNVFRC